MPLLRSQRGMGRMGGKNLEAGNIAFSFKKFIFKNETEGDGIEPPLNCAGDRGLI